MTLKDFLIQELDNVSDPLIAEVLDFLRFLKTKHTQDSPAHNRSPYQTGY